MSLSSIQTNIPIRQRYLDIPSQSSTTTFAGQVVNSLKSIDITIGSTGGSGFQGPQGLIGNIGPQGLIGNIGSQGNQGPAGGGGGTNVEVVTGSQPLDPDINISIVSGGTSHALPAASSNGANKIIIDNINRNIVSMQSLGKWNPINNVWTAFASITSGYTVWCMTLDNTGNNLYVGGQFVNINGISNTRSLAKYNFSTNTWSSLGTGLTAVSLPLVRTLLFDSTGDNLYVGGGFTSAGGVANTNGIAKYNVLTNTWSSLGTGIDGNAYALAFDSSNNLIVGGINITTAGGISVSLIAKYNPNSDTWSSLNSVLDGNINAIALDSIGNIYVGGGLVAPGVANPLIAKYDPITNIWSYPILANGGVWSLAMDSSDNLYIGGGFIAIGPYIVKYNTITEVTSNLGSGLDSTARSMILDSSGDLYIGGEFTTAGGVTANRIAKWNPVSNLWVQLDTGLNGIVLSIVIDSSGNLIVGGNFTANTVNSALTITGTFTNFTSGAATYNNTTLSSTIQGKNTQLVYLSSIGSWVPVNTQYSSFAIA